MAGGTTTSRDATGAVHRTWLAALLPVGLSALLTGATAWTGLAVGLLVLGTALAAVALVRTVRADQQTYGLAWISCAATVCQWLRVLL